MKKLSTVAATVERARLALVVILDELEQRSDPIVDRTERVNTLLNQAIALQLVVKTLDQYMTRYPQQ